MFERCHYDSYITAKDILELAEWIKESNISIDTPVFISEMNEGFENKAIDLKADENSINFYDWT